MSKPERKPSRLSVPLTEALDREVRAIASATDLKQGDILSLMQDHLTKTFKTMDAAERLNAKKMEAARQKIEAAGLNVDRGSAAQKGDPAAPGTAK